MNLPLAPPPGLPLSTVNPSTKEALIQQLTVGDTSYLIPFLTLALLSFYALSEVLKWLFPPKKKPANWQEEYIDPIIGTSSAALTTTEIVTHIFYKDPDLATHLEPLLHEIDLVNFSTKKENLLPLIAKAKTLFAAAHPKKLEGRK